MHVKLINIKSVRNARLELQNIGAILLANMTRQDRQLEALKDNRRKVQGV